MRGCRARHILTMEFKAETIAQYIGGRVEGNPDAIVRTFGKIDEAGGGAITFLANPKYTHCIYTTGASVVLVREDFVAEQPVRATLIRVPDPYGALAGLLAMAAGALEPHPVGIEQPCHIAEGVEIDSESYVGAFAYIGKGARLGKRVKIYPQAYIGDGVTIGDDTTVYAGAKIYYGCRIGARCAIHSGAVIGADGFGFAPDAAGVYQKIHQIGIVEIDDDVEIGANTTVDRATMGRTHIARGVKLDNLVQVAHNVEIGADTVIAAQTGVAGSTRLGHNCMIGGQVGFAGHITVGDGVTIGAQSGIPNHVASGSRLMGYPAVPAGDFARQNVHIKRLGKLYDRVSSLEKSLGDFLEKSETNNA